MQIQTDRPSYTAGELVEGTVFIVANGAALSVTRALMKGAFVFVTVSIFILALPMRLAVLKLALVPSIDSNLPCPCSCRGCGVLS